MATAPLIRTARDAALLCEPHLGDLTREGLVVAHLAADRTLLHLTVEERGGDDHIDLPVRAIIAEAIGHRSAGLILAHCHPSGDPNPSEEDRLATRRLAEMAAGLGIILHDHLVFGGGECRSFRALGLL